MNKSRFLWDFSGAFGDIGVLFPLAIALVAKNGFNPTAVFLMAGIFYFASAYYFKVTMPVQPLKAMSAIAITTGLGFEVINAAGVIMGIVLFVIAVTGLSVRLGSIFPVSVVRGIQLGLGMMLVNASMKLMGSDWLIAAFSAALLVSSMFVFRKVPPLIPVLVLGAAFSLKGINITSLGPVPLAPVLPRPGDLWTGLGLLVLPQIALTFGNAIVATEATGKILYGGRAGMLDLRSIPLSMSAANMVSGIMGGAPMCHGSGGLTAHHKFGATSERSGYIIGATLIALALLFGDSALALISAFPVAILGVLLCYVGIQHSMFMRDILGDGKSVVIALTVAVLGFATHNLSIGFLAGLAAHYGIVGLKKTAYYLGK